MRAAFSSNFKWVSRSTPRKHWRIRQRFTDQWHGHTAARILVLVSFLLAVPPVEAQRRPTTPQRRPRPAPAAQSNALRGATEGLINIDYPNTVDLAAFVDFVSQSLDLKIMYGGELRGQAIVFRPGTVAVPKENLLDLLRSMLRMQDLALVEGDLEGWWRIVDSGDMQRHVHEIRGSDATEEIAKSNRVVTQVVQISSEDFENVLKYAQQFLSSSKASVIQVPEKGLLIITDYEAAVAKALEIIKLVDVAPRAAQVVTVNIEHLDAQGVADQVVKILTDKARVEGRSAPQLAIQPNQQGGSILLVGLSGEIEEAKELIAQLDTPPAGARAPVAYSPQFISAGRLAKLIDALIAPTLGKGSEAQFLLDEDSNRLYVTAAPSVHRQIEQLLAREDVKSAEPSRPLRIYKPRNRLARELMGTLSEVLPNVKVTTADGGEVDETKAVPNLPPGPNRPPAEPGPGQAPPVPPAQEPYEVRIERPAGVTRVEGDDFTLSYDEHTNAIIAIGPREFHHKVEMLLEELDKRQPQVLIEMTLVAYLQRFAEPGCGAGQRGAAQRLSVPDFFQLRTVGHQPGDGEAGLSPRRARPWPVPPGQTMPPVTE